MRCGGLSTVVKWRNSFFSGLPLFRFGKGFRCLLIDVSVRARWRANDLVCVGANGEAVRCVNFRRVTLINKCAWCFAALLVNVNRLRGVLGFAAIVGNVGMLIDRLRVVVASSPHQGSMTFEARFGLKLSVLARFSCVLL